MPKFARWRPSHDKEDGGGGAGAFFVAAFVAGFFSRTRRVGVGLRARRVGVGPAVVVAWPRVGIVAARARKDAGETRHQPCARPRGTNSPIFSSAGMVSVASIIVWGEYRPCQITDTCQTRCL